MSDQNQFHVPPVPPKAPSFSAPQAPVKKTPPDNGGKYQREEYRYFVIRIVLKVR